MRYVYKLRICHGSTILQYEDGEHKDIFKSVRRATKNKTWTNMLTGEDTKKLIITPEEAKKIDWLKPLLDESEKSITIKEGPGIVSVMIKKVKLM